MSKMLVLLIAFATISLTALVIAAPLTAPQQMDCADCQHQTQVTKAPCSQHAECTKECADCPQASECATPCPDKAPCGGSPADCSSAGVPCRK